MSASGNGAPVAGIDLGGTKILAGVMGPDNQVLGRAKVSTPAQQGGEAILKAIVECVDSALGAAGLRRDDLAAVGIGSPGPLDTAAGTIVYSSNLNVRNFPLGPGLAAELRKPVTVRNDVVVGGYGEFRLGAGKGFRDLIAVFVGTGIGGCLVSRGRVVEGVTGNAGEVGHIVVKAGGPKCGCGSRGCLEAMASRTAIVRRVGKAVKKGIPTTLGERVARKSGRLKSHELADAVNAGDHVAIEETRRAAHFLGLGVGGLINVFAPEVVVIGGGVAEAMGEPWVELIRASARAQAVADPQAKTVIALAALGDDSGILGAALLAREALQTGKGTTALGHDHDPAAPVTSTGR